MSKNSTGILIQTFLIFILLILIRHGNLYLIEFVSVIILVYGFILFQKNRIARSLQFTKDFTFLKETNNFAETGQSLFFPEKKHRHVLLIIHGYSATPGELRLLNAALQKEGIPYYAPLLSGFGLKDLTLLNHVKRQDWLREVIHAYDLLAAISDKVSVLGHSMGGLLACRLAEFRTPHKIILSAPYITLRDDHEKLKKLARTTFGNWFFRNIYPSYVRKSGAKKGPDEHYPNKRFAYDLVPLSSVFEMWELQEDVNYSQMKYDELLVLFGAKDRTTLKEKVVKLFEENNLRFKEIVYQDSGHGLFDSNDSSEVVRDSVKFLKDENES
ncbi:MAG: alpha/beta fold hydrolase [Ignavibacteriaceae bacterium]|nr:alpha/beta fold hydrolase [Ignavibacteriaceae bacterium]